MGMSLDVGQYGGSRAPAVSPAAGGAAVIGSLGTAAMGMLTGGGSAVIGAALEAAKEGTTTQTAESGKVSNTTGSKVFNGPGAGDAMLNNPFWMNATGNNQTSSIVLIVGLLFLGLVGIMVAKFALK